MYKSWAFKFGLRWLVSSLGLFVADGILGDTRIDVKGGLGTFLLAGFFLALINMSIKPLLVILSFPAIILSLGLFMLVINGLVLLIADWIYEPLFVKNLGVAIVAGVIIGIVNYLVTRIIGDI